MNEPWPPPAPDIPKHFEQAVEASQNGVGIPQAQDIVTKSQIEVLEQQNKKTTPQLNLNPPGIKPSIAINRAKLERIEKMKQRLMNNEGRARGDFGRSAGREV